MRHGCSQGRRLLGLALAGLGLTAAPVHGALPAGADVERSASTGKVRFVGSGSGGALRRPAGFTAASDPAAVGRGFLQENASDFGLGPASSVRATRTVRRPRGSVVRYQQMLNGVPVVGGEFVVRLDPSNAIRSTMGEATPAASIDAWPELSTDDAERAAVEVVAKNQSVPTAELRAQKPALFVFDPAVVGGPGVPGPRLVWSVEVEGGLLIRERVFVDAKLGAIVASFDGTPEAKSRLVCDNANTFAPANCTAPVRTEGGPAVAVDDVNDAYVYSGATYDYFASQFGRDSIDDAGMPLESTVRYCVNTSPCPYSNANWNGEQMIYGAGWANGDDVVAHELAHGVTEHSANLFYYFQSGAINESLSDIFGELVDQANAWPGEPTGDRWKLGEQMPGGALRDMANPPLAGHPDRMQSASYYVGEDDGGGVHLNSGVGNKAAFLMVDGTGSGTFNGQSIAPIGATKTAAIFYEVQTAFLTAAGDYVDLGTAMNEACAGLIGTKGITAADCTQVGKVVTATEMLVQRPPPGAADMPECTTGAPGYVYSDDIEGPKTFTEDAFGAGEFEWYTDYPDEIADFASSGDTNWWGWNKPFADSYSITQNSAVTIPADGFFRFRHAHSFENNGSNTYDGGVVEYTTNGTTWLDAVGSTPGVYNGSIINSGSNPLGGRPAFVGPSHGYRTTVVPVGGLAGQSVRFRFRIGTDSSTQDFGWWMDDFAIGSCGAPGTYSVDASSSASEGGGADRLVVRRTGGSGPGTVRIETTKAGSADEGGDFATASVQRNIAPDSTVTIPLTVVNDAAFEGNETIGVTISSPAAPHPTFAKGTVTLSDNEQPPSPPPSPVDPGPGGSSGTSGGGAAVTGGAGSGTAKSGGAGRVPGPLATLASARAGKRSVAFRMTLLVPGTVTVSGRLKGRAIRASRRFTKAGAATITAPFSRKVRMQLRRRAANVRFTITFRPAAGGTPVVTRRVVRLPRRR